MSKQKLRIGIHIHFDFVNFRLGDDLYTKSIYDQIEYQVKCRDILISNIFKCHYSKDNKFTINGKLYKPIDDIILSYYPEYDDIPLYPFIGYISNGTGVHNIRTTVELAVEGEGKRDTIIFIDPFIGLHELEDNKVQIIRNNSDSPNNITIVFTEHSNLKPIILFG